MSDFSIKLFNDHEQYYLIPRSIKEKFIKYLLGGELVREKKV